MDSLVIEVLVNAQRINNGRSVLTETKLEEHSTILVKVYLKGQSIFLNYTPTGICYTPLKRLQPRCNQVTIPLA